MFILIKSYFSRFAIHGMAVFALLAICTPSQAALVDSLRSYWSFDDNLTDLAHGLAGSGSTVADNGTFAGTNGGYQAGKFGSAFDTNTTGNGVNGTAYVVVAASADTRLSGAADLSVSAWVRWNGLTNVNFETALSHGDQNFEYRIGRNGTTANVIRARVSNADTPGDVSINPFDGAWHHLAFTYDNDGGANNFSFWVDGIEATATQAAGAFGTQNNDFWIGNNSQQTARIWGGQIDDMAVWDRVITDAEIAAIYNSGTGASIAELIPEPSGIALLLSTAAISALGWRRMRANTTSSGTHQSTT